MYYEFCTCAGSRERCDWNHTSPTPEHGVHLLRGWIPEAVETLNYTQQVMINILIQIIVDSYLEGHGSV